MNRGVSLKDFEIDDLKLMRIEEDGYELISEYNVNVGDAKTIIYGKDVLGSMGYCELWPGVCEVWCMYNQNSKHGGVFLMVVRDALIKLFKDKKLHRIQATGIHNLKSDMFFERLGFQDEGVLRKYSISGRDYKMWSRVKC
jgi:L-amino acid N-acyltransferase YncA